MKQGLDDYIIKCSADELRKLIDATPEWNLSRELYELNATYIYIRGMSSIVERTTGRIFAPRVFVNELEAPRKTTIIGADGKPRLVSAAKTWLESPMRSTAECITYQPGAEQITADGGYNTWKPSGIEPRKGDISLYSKLLSHLVPDADEREWVECWCAAPLQQPGLKMSVALAIWGEKQGNGKTLFGTTISRLHGEGNYIEIGQAELVSTYNDWQAGITFGHLSEVCGERESRPLADKIKNIITGETIAVNKKYVPLYTLPNCMNCFFTSNHENALYLQEHSRRFTVIHAKNDPLPTQFYKDFCRWRDNGGLSAIVDHLLRKDLSRFNPKGHGLKTAAREEMIAASRTLVQEWVHELRVNTDTALAIGNVTTPGAFFTTAELLRIFSRGEQNRLTEKGMANALRAEGFKPALDGSLIRIPNTDLRLRLWVIRDELRAANMSAGQIGDAYMRQNSARGKGLKFASK
jgi:hypothetical protein